MRDLRPLSDIEFEALCGDLLGAESGLTFERFRRAPDGGVDLRAYDGGTHIVQCKHYARTQFSGLYRDLEAELSNVEKEDPDTYRVATSLELTRHQKDRIYHLFDAWMPNTSYVMGAHDIDALLTKHPDVERRYVKVWISSGGVLQHLLHSATFERSAHLVELILETLPRYVESRSFENALRILDDHRACIISGPPGIGKTTLGRILLARAIKQGYEPIEVTQDIEEAWATWDARTVQAFFYDDFLGRVSFGERLGKNEDHRLVDFIDRVRRSESKLIVLTTREHILESARRDYEKLNRMDDRLRFVLELRDYSRLDRAKILYNHLWHSALVDEDLRALLHQQRYLEIVDHRNFSPRLVEYITKPPIARSPANGD